MNAFHFTVNLFGGRHSATGRIYVNNDGFDGILVLKLTQVFHCLVRIENDAVEVHDTDFVAERMQAGLVIPAHSQQDQRENGKHKEAECASSNEDPKPDSRTSIVSHKR